MGDAVDSDDAGQQARTGRRRLIIGVVAAVLVVGGFFFGRALWWSLRPTPDFPSLAADPDESLVGTVAFIRPFPEDDRLLLVTTADDSTTRVLVDGGFGQAITADQVLGGTGS